MSGWDEADAQVDTRTKGLGVKSVWTMMFHASAVFGYLSAPIKELCVTVPNGSRSSLGCNHLKNLFECSGFNLLLIKLTLFIKVKNGSKTWF